MGDIARGESIGADVEGSGERSVVALEVDLPFHKSSLEGCGGDEQGWHHGTMGLFLALSVAHINWLKD